MVNRPRVLGVFTSRCTLPSMHIDCISVIADDQATEPEQEASYVWSFREALTSRLIMGPLRSQRGFCTKLYSPWINKPLLHKRPARPTLIIIQSKTMGFRGKHFMVSELVWVGSCDGLGQLETPPCTVWYSHQIKVADDAAGRKARPPFISY